jgi:hypothetical protein
MRMFLTDAHERVPAWSRNTDATGGEFVTALAEKIANNNRRLPVMPLIATGVHNFFEGFVNNLCGVLYGTHSASCS